MVRRGGSRTGLARQAWIVAVGRGEDRDRHGESRQGWLGSVWLGWLGQAQCGLLRTGAAWQDLARSRVAGKVWSGAVRRGEQRPDIVRRGVARAMAIWFS